jgi:hypothetical protein
MDDEAGGQRRSADRDSRPLPAGVLRAAPGAASVVLVVLSVLLSPGTADLPKEESSPRVINVELGGICGMLVGAGVTVAGFVQEAMNKARGGWAGAAVAAGCLLYDGWEYKKKYDSTPERVAEFAEIKRRWESYRTYEELMTKGFGCELKTLPKISPDDVNETVYRRWDCSKGPYANYD